MAQERRSESRKVLSGPQQGELSVRFQGRELPALAIVDVSPTGVGLLLAEPVPVGTQLEVSYRHDAVEIHMAGIAIWGSRRRSPDGDEARAGYAVGINLVSPTLLHNLL